MKVESRQPLRDHYRCISACDEPTVPIEKCAVKGVSVVVEDPALDGLPGGLLRVLFRGRVGHLPPRSRIAPHCTGIGDSFTQPALRLNLQMSRHISQNNVLVGDIGEEPDEVQPLEETHLHCQSVPPIQQIVKCLSRYGGHAFNSQDWPPVDFQVIPMSKIGVQIFEVPQIACCIGKTLIRVGIQGVVVWTREVPAEEEWLVGLPVHQHHLQGPGAHRPVVAPVMIEAEPSDPKEVRHDAHIAAVVV